MRCNLLKQVTKVFTKAPPSASLPALAALLSVMATLATPYSQAIVGGTEVAAGDVLANKVVLILGTTQTGGRGYCSGTMIDKDIVLTAAHCFETVIKNYYVIPNINMSPDSGYEREKFNIPVTKWVIHEDYDKPDAKVFSDIALLKLERAVPEKYTPVKFYDGRSEAAPFAILAGFGKTSESRIDQTYLRFTAKENSEIKIDYKDQIGTMIMSNGQTKGACEGDSGGPVFYGVNGEFQQVGIISTTVGPDIMSTCSGLVIATHLPRFLPWIEKNKSLLNEQK
ncbi:S1 family peptidase [Bdellovibrio sp. HCB288]|uniref:S1 family peptidase n=1 Tax=Bdellovibrio sp. HCB288 TaxID=3394355 RepID=UPI0039B6BA94